MTSRRVSHTVSPVNKDLERDRPKKKSKRRLRDSEYSESEEEHERAHKKRESSNPQISEDDYYSKSTEFRTWLREEKQKYFDEMSSHQTRKYFRKFVRAWNKDKLDKKYYDGIRSSQVNSAESTRYKWKINVSQDELEQVKSSVDRQTNVKFDAKFRAHVGISGGDGGYTASSASTTTTTEQSKDVKKRPIIGPTMPPPSSSRYDEDMDEEDRQRYEHSFRKKERKEFQKTHETVLEELVPKATGREAMIEKKKAQNAKFRRETSPDVELNDQDLMGGDDFQTRLAARDRSREMRNKKRDEYRAEKVANLQEKATAYQNKEQQTLEMFKQMAELQRKAGGGLWGSKN
ncbi:1599_t:CDS:2 [Ambispora gerdemannii]|uniref:1599_t:CDS:1 n=1 Tax=Ambispora gerdemannii TaxID=144530 RepID=A0A9N9AN92_9GLOM|nr:1599_t:CDS:2 [Ambispora gerdemannii]